MHVQYVLNGRGQPRDRGLPLPLPPMLQVLPLRALADRLQAMGLLAPDRSGAILPGGPRLHSTQPWSPSSPRRVLAPLRALVFFPAYFPGAHILYRDGKSLFYFSKPY